MNAKVQIYHIRDALMEASVLKCHGCKMERIDRRFW
jgi:hypothetical protein